MAAPKPLCPLCRQRLVQPIGPREADILIAGEFPGWTEIKTGVPFSDRAGNILRRELRRVGINYMACRVTNLWLHAKHPGGRSKAQKEELEIELNWHRGQLLEELKGRRAVLLLGSDVTEALTGYHVLDVAGLNLVRLPKKALLDRFAKRDTIVMAAPNPAVVYQKGQTAGELTLAFDKFAEAYNQLKGR